MTACTGTTPGACGYDLERPSAAMILTSLARYLDDDELPHVWASACGKAGVDQHQPPQHADDLLAVVDALEQCGDLAAVCAKGLRIRIMSWRVLSRAAGTKPTSTR